MKNYDKKMRRLLELYNDVIEAKSKPFNTIYTKGNLDKKLIEIKHLLEELSNDEALMFAYENILNKLIREKCFAAAFMSKCDDIGFNIRELFRVPTHSNFRILSDLFDFFITKGNLQNFGYRSTNKDDRVIYEITFNTCLESISNDYMDISKSIQPFPGCYIVPCGANRIKIGSSKDIQKRIANVASIVRCYTGYEIKQSLGIQCNKYRELEIKLHTMFSDLRVHGEIFNVDFEQFIDMLYEAEYQNLINFSDYIYTNEEVKHLIGLDNNNDI